jgi:outer membrane protein assembly factor BamB
MCKGRSLLPLGLLVALLMYCSVEKMMKRKILILYTLLVFIASFVGTFLVLQRMPTHTHAIGASTAWTMFQGNLGHSGFNGAETILNATTAPQMKVLWTRHAAGGISSQVVEANGLLYWGSWDGFEHASNPTTGADVWATNVGTTTPGGGACCPPSAGSSGAAAVTSVPINGTTTSVAFVSGGNATLYALNASTGAILWSTRLGAPPSHMLWAGPVVYQGSAYVGVASYCDCPLVQGQLVQVNASTGAVQHTFNVVPNGCVGGGIWDTPSIDPVTNILYVSTGTHSSCSQAGNLAMGLLALRTTDLSLVSSWLLPLAQGPGDSDFGSTPTLFPATIGGTVHQMVGLVNKNGVYYALDRANLSAGPLWHFQVSLGIAGGGGNNFSSSGWDGSRLYVAGGGTTINGTRCSGSLRALNPATGTPIWGVCLGADVNSSIMVVPGLVALGAGTQVVAVDAATGRQVFTFNDTSTRSHFVSSATIVNGNLYLGNEDGNLYAFGVSGTPPPPPPSSTPGTSKAPVSKTWYFAEGKVGQGFTEFLTLENPGSVSCAANIQYLLGSGGPVTVPVTVPPFSRYTESVNNDLHMSASGSGYQTDSAIVSVTNAPCTGVVAERPMYFTNFKGISSGTDVVGATHTGSDFYFADVSSLPSYHSYLTILNPPGGATATITATYSQGGTVLGTDTLAVPAGTRGTILPKSFGQRVATWVHASAPVVVERPTYFSTYSSGNAHTISGAASVVGASAPANDWRFAEGYTGAGFQENLLLANFGATAATGRVVLEYDTGATLTNTVNVPAHAALSLDVNNATASKQGTCAPLPCVLSQSVSAEITMSTGAIVAEREMFFQYSHFDRLTGRTVLAQGGTDVTGQAGVARLTAYSFAEGYTNQDYDEWLTVQNPTAISEPMSVILVNDDEHAYTQQYTVGAHTRYTIDVGALVSQHLIQPGETYRGYEVSMTVQSTSGVFVAERPMYWDTGAGGTQGGSDVIGYLGN